MCQDHRKIILAKFPVDAVSRKGPTDNSSSTPRYSGIPHTLVCDLKAERVPVSLGLVLMFLLRILVSKSKFMLPCRIPGSEDMTLKEYREIKDQQSRMSLHIPHPTLLEP